MHLLLNSKAGLSVGQFPSQVSNRGGSPVSTFSLLLAGQLAGTEKDQAVFEHGSDQNDSLGQKGDSELEASVPGRSEVNGNQDQAQDSSSHKQVQDSGVPSTSDGEGTLAGGLESLGVLTGLFQTPGPTGMAAGSIPDFGMANGLPAEFQARLAGDIAAGFSNRNGIQTLVLKLDSDHLGQVDVRLQAKGDHLSVRLLAANRESEAALRGNIKELSEAIQKRTGRFQQVEVRVDLKSSEESGQEPTDEEPGHSSKRDSRGDNSEGSDTRREADNQKPTEFEMAPDDRVQGG